VRLTESGEVLLEEARELLRRSLVAEDTVQRAIRGERGRVRVGCVELVMLSPLPMAIRDYRRQCPDVDLTLDEMTSAPQLEALNDGALDVAIVVGDGDFQRTLTVRHLLTVPVGIALPTDHRLASRTVLSLEDVSQDELIMPPRAQEPTLHDRRIKLCVDAGFTPKIREERSFRSRLGLVAAGYGVTTVPGIDTETPPEGVVFRRLSGPISEFNVDILCRAESTGPAALNFSDYVIDRVATHSGTSASTEKSKQVG
jgi:DNA-binding transcriptional LysR family regulator